MAVAPGTRFGPYEIVGPVPGGMGEVYKARDTRLHRDVAIKVLPAALTGEAAARERFLREAPDGQRFLMIREDTVAADGPTVVVVKHWFRGTEAAGADQPMSAVVILAV